MTKRVHQLAKELKISTHALKKHLADMGVEVKSHMSPVEDDVVEKIKAKFKQEVDAEKKMETVKEKITVVKFENHNKKGWPLDYRTEYYILPTGAVPVAVAEVEWDTTTDNVCIKKLIWN
ncbi:MAG TPA: hypothetical protein DHM37_00760, partial [Candidatus Cloacimonas sp.]|nr:hypothetical protein [Candidatus Cloacimonas sp.]